MCEIDETSGDLRDVNPQAGQLLEERFSLWHLVHRVLNREVLCQGLTLHPLHQRHRFRPPLELDCVSHLHSVSFVRVSEVPRC